MVDRMFRSLTLAATLLAAPASAEAPMLLEATATPGGGGWTISVTLMHADTGWDHYASGVKVLAPDGSPLAEIDIPHPHDAGVPFTETVAGVAVPPGAHHVLLRLRCTLDGWEARSHRLDLPH